MRRAVLTVLILSLLIVVGRAQAPPAQPPAGQAPAGQAPGQPPQPVFRGSTRLVVQNVFVKDRDGNPIPELTEKDFVVFEDNQRQEIAFVEYQRIVNDPIVDLPDPLPSDNAAGAQSVANVEIATPPAGSIKYQNKRLLVLYFDLSSMPLTDQLRSYENARKYLDGQMTTSDLVAVMSFKDGVLRVLHDFTANRAALREVIDVLQVGDGLSSDDLE